MRYRYCLFDLDGTLTRSENGIFGCVINALNEMHREIPGNDVLQKFIGPPLLDSFMDYLGMSREEAEEAVARYRVRYSRVGWSENEVYTGIPQLLKSLHAAGGKVYLASSKPKEFCERILAHFGLAPFFSGVAAPGTDNIHVPKKELIESLLQTGIPKDEVVMIGDRLYDIEGANQAGVPSIGCTYGYGSFEELTGAGATHIASSVDALKELLLDPGEEVPGCFISFEGSDGCGKTTQLNKMHDWLRQSGWDVVFTREPGGDEVAEKIRSLVLDREILDMTPTCEALLYAASRAQHAERVIRPALNSGKLVLCDRYIDSSIAYQGYGRELTENWIRQINQKATDISMPDLTILFEIDPAKALDRRLHDNQPDRIEREGLSFFERVQYGFSQAALHSNGRIVSVDASGERNEIHDCVRIPVMQILQGI